MSGRKVACKGCGAVIRVPASGGLMAELIRKPEPVASGDSEMGYALADPDQEPASVAAVAGVTADGGKCPSCNAKLKPGAVVCMNCGFNLQTGEKLSTSVGAAPTGGGGAAAAPAVGAATLNRAVFDTRSKVDDAAMDEDLARETQWKYLYTPLILIGVGLVWILLNAVVLGPMAIETNAFVLAQGGATSYDRVQGILFVLLDFLVRLVISVPLMLGALFIVASLFGTSFGTLGSAMLRLLAVVLVIIACDDMVSLGVDIVTGGFGGIGFMLEASISILVFFAISMWQLETDVMETMVLWFLTVFAPGLIVGFVGLIVLGLLFA
ncbi:MAG: zinc ribbon domain-containing protein [Planctomycetota bacterium]